MEASGSRETGAGHKGSQDTDQTEERSLQGDQSAEVARLLVRHLATKAEEPPGTERTVWQQTGDCPEAPDTMDGGSSRRQASGDRLTTGLPSQALLFLG